MVRIVIVVAKETWNFSRNFEIETAGPEEVKREKNSRPIVLIMKSLIARMRNAVAMQLPGRNRWPPGVVRGRDRS